MKLILELLNHRHLYGCSVEKMIVKSTLVLALLVSGELVREDHYNCTSKQDIIVAEKYYGGLTS